MSTNDWNLALSEGFLLIVEQVDNQVNRYGDPFVDNAVDIAWENFASCLPGRSRPAEPRGTHVAPVP
jgi:hypothetical protein